MNVPTRTSRLAKWALGGCLALVLPLAMAAGPKTYTSTGDFGPPAQTMSGVDAAQVPDQLQLSVVGTTFPTLWIANAGEDTVSKVDSSTGKEIARYRTWFGPGSPSHYSSAHGPWDGPAPSRTAVDLSGNAYVLNRHFEGRPALLIKILNSGGIDRNGNGQIDTSSDVNNDGVIQGGELMNLNDTAPTNGVIDQAEIQDERIAWASPVGPSGALGRSLCIGTDGHLWVGLYNSGHYYKVSSVDGSILAGPVASGNNAYGCVIERDGTLWGANLNGSLTKITNTASNSGPYTVTQVAHPQCGSSYGITAGNGKVYAACYGTAIGYVECNPATNTCVRPGTPGSGVPGSTPSIQATGISVDGSGNIVVGRINGTGGVWKQTASHQPVCANVNGTSSDHRGAIVDSNQNIWQMGVNNHNMRQFSGSDCSTQLTVPVGRHPYTYSDASGFAARNATNRTGTWTMVQDGGAGARWGKISWNANVPNGASVQVSIDANDNPNALQDPPSTTVTNGNAFSKTGRYLKIQVRLNANQQDQSPLLLDLTATPSTCDADADGDVDSSDLSLIQAARNTLVSAGNYDARDANFDGKIDLGDYRTCATRCTRPSCTTGR